MGTTWHHLWNMGANWDRLKIAWPYLKTARRILRQQNEMKYIWNKIIGNYTVITFALGSQLGVTWRSLGYELGVTLALGRTYLCLLGSIKPFFQNKNISLFDDDNDDEGQVPISHIHLIIDASNVLCTALLLLPAIYDAVTWALNFPGSRKHPRLPLPSCRRYIT